jgi:hypothetical protein
LYIQQAKEQKRAFDQPAGRTEEFRVDCLEEVACQLGNRV